MHREAGSPIGRCRVGLVLGQLLDPAEAGDLPATLAGGSGPDGEARLLREVELLDRGDAGLRVARVHEDRLRLAVLDDVRDLGAGQVEVDGREVEAGLRRGEEELDGRHAVGQHLRDRVAGLEPERPEAVDQPVRAGEQLAGRVLGAVGLDHREVRRVLGRVHPESTGHRFSLASATPGHAGDARPARVEHVL